mmetsp:Transcript_34145/g.108320  ORF Transcript_34145/g.108320 Transcript_34145/m.108320 type:complete len:328 (-) Transcript_34145:2-985(-)
MLHLLRKLQSGHALDVLRVLVALWQESPRGVDLASDGGPHESGHALLVGLGGVGTRRKQHVHGFAVAALCREHEGRAEACGFVGVHIGLVCDKHLASFLPTSEGGHHERAHALLVVCVAGEVRKSRLDLRHIALLACLQEARDDILVEADHPDVPAWGVHLRCELRRYPEGDAVGAVAGRRLRVFGPEVAGNLGEGLKLLGLQGGGRQLRGDLALQDLHHAVLGTVPVQDHVAVPGGLSARDGHRLLQNLALRPLLEPAPDAEANIRLVAIARRWLELLLQRDSLHVVRHTRCIGRHGSFLRLLSTCQRGWFTKTARKRPTQNDLST